MQYFEGQPIISDQITKSELAVLVRELERVIDGAVEGDVVEFGCYEGTSALFEARLIRKLAPNKKLWLYDSFEGLPPKVNHDASPAGTQFVEGALRASKARLIGHFKKAGLPMPVIKKAWFKDLKPGDLPDNICFAFLDGDYYESITDSLGLVWPKLCPGAVVIVDDYHNEALPGAAKAVDVWLKTHPASISIETSLAIIRV